MKKPESPLIPPRKPGDEDERLDALRALNALDTPQEERYDRITRELAETLDVPIAYLALIDADRQWLKSQVGDMPCEVDRSRAFCSHTILQDEPLIIPDTHKDPRFADHPLVIAEPHLRFYAGIPLESAGHNIGTLCVADTEPRQLNLRDLRILTDFATRVQDKINQQPKVFISYSHHDEAWKDRLVQHLEVLQQQNLLDLWEDRRMAGGDLWQQEIEDAIESANVAILLISAEFLTSKFIMGVEVPHILRRRDSEGMSILPLIIKACSWGHVSWLESMNLRPRDGKPLSGESDHQIDQILARFGSEVLETSRGTRAPSAASAASVGQQMEQPAPAPPEDAVLKTLLVSDLVGSTRLVEELGDAVAAELFQRHDRLARDLLKQHGGQEIDKTDGFLHLFERPISAVLYALAYHRALRELSGSEGLELAARVGIHLGEVILRENPLEDVARGAKKLEVEGLAKPVAARLMSLAAGGQTLLTRGAFDVARRGAVDATSPGADLRWLAHGAYLLKGVDEAVRIYEVGVEGVAPLAPPPDSAKAKRASDQDRIPGWRPAPGLEIPQRPHWVVENKLGEGGFGETWLGRHTKTRDRRVFKFCYEPRSLRSLQREITLFRLLKGELGDRDDISRILDWNFDRAPYFLESEYTAGGDLVDWAAEQGGIAQVPLEQRLGIVAGIAEALAAAHSVGVLHKDVKPANVLITTDLDGNPRPRLTDFGIGRVTDRDRLADAGITMMGMTELFEPTASTVTSISGTRLYMAPELLEGRPATVQADVYALGVMLFQTVVGDLRRALAPGWRREIEDELLCEDVAAAVDGSPQRRLGNALRLAERLRSLPERREQRAAEEREREQRAREHREVERAKAALARSRKRRRVMAGAIALLTLFGGAMAFQARRIADEAARANREAETARQVSEFLQDLFEVSDPGEARGEAITARELLDRGAEKISQLGDQPLTQARLMGTIGEVYRKLGFYEQAASLLEQALDRRQSLLDAEHPDVADSLSSLATLYEEQGRYAEAEPLFRRSLAIREQTFGGGHPEVASSLNGLGLLYVEQGKYAEAEPLLERCLAIRQRTLGLDHPDLIVTLTILGINHFYQGHHAEAGSLFERVLAIQEQTLGSDHPDTANALNNLATILMVQGDWAAAEKSLKQAWPILEKSLGPDHRSVAGVLNNLAEAYKNLGRYAEAEPLLQRVLASRKKVFGGDHAEVAMSLHNLAEFYKMQARHDAAEPLFQRALEIRETALDGDHPFVASTLHHLGELYADLGRYDEAEPLLRRALAIREKVFDPGDKNLAATLDAYAALLRATGREAEAAELEERAAAGDSDRGGSSEP